MFIGEALFEHPLPWAEDEYLALGVTSNRVELLDGCLLVSPAPVPRHQSISGRLAAALVNAADTAGLSVLTAVNVRLKRVRIPIPDLVIAERVDPDSPVIDASAVRLVCEIVSPESAAIDRVLKMHYYAEAQIPFYLLVEQRPAITFRLFALEPGGYRETAVATATEILRLTEPVAVELSPAALDWPR